MATKKTSKKTTKTETAPKTEASEKDEKVLKVKRIDAAKLLRVMGFKDTQKYSNDLLEKRLNKMEQYKANYDGTLDGDTEEMVDKIIAAKGNIQVTGDELKGSKKEAPEGGKKANSKTTEKAIGKGGEKKAKKTTSKGAEGVDAFGSRIGSNNAKVNAMLGKKPITMKDIKAKMRGTYYNHLNALIEQKLVVKTDEGFALVK